MRTPVVNIPLHRFAAIVIGTFVLVAEALATVIFYEQSSRFRTGMRVEDVSSVLMWASGLPILLLVPFLFRRKEWARIGIVWLLVAGAIFMVITGATAAAEAKRSILDRTGIALLGCVMLSIATTAILFLINRPLVDEFGDQRSQPTKPNSEQL